ncbi:VOC family protein [Ruegeria arenilitoris]|uniref:Glyoxalase/Bleomycin resistance protein/Dioxygenase superfamily protein n=1 Tax=Ruegeria arenilitoris TaxID=1173585 RepID=A0A238JYA7_9RHOB|nr:VOC family protein [Ruegeria arenilitoris]SMX35167.1 Glyoxalase/Bleomycin resistance protein/Dioxygenase superfamily protein [Ruegeria arenilitoris]
MQQGLHAVTLVVPDYDDAIAFYTKTLRFRLTQDIDLGEGKRWVLVTPPGSDGAALLLAKADGDSQRAAIGIQTGGRVGFFLRTDDFARDHADMLANGVRFEEEPRYEPYGIVAVWQDPFGNRWDLIQFT